MSLLPTVQIIKSALDYPNIHVAMVPHLGNEFQIEQGTEAGDPDLLNFNNDVISIPFETAVELAHTILKIAEEA